MLSPARGLGNTLLTNLLQSLTVAFVSLAMHRPGQVAILMAGGTNGAECMAEADEEFLGCVLQALERLRAASQERGHPMLASMIEFAKVEAEDDLRTRSLAVRRFSEFRALRLSGVSAPL